ncbi:hypothetical protein AGMMS50284_3640 [Clostridia bacterium]|nr:hypothetical protein AGMMS50284_3640 [Clostridia bacterium]
MPDITKLDAAAQEYFYSMPVTMQEMIIQSDVNVSSKEDLEKFFKNTMNRPNSPQ